MEVQRGWHVPRVIVELGRCNLTAIGTLAEDSNCVSSVLDENLLKARNVDTAPLAVVPYSEFFCVPGFPFASSHGLNSTTGCGQVG